MRHAARPHAVPERRRGMALVVVLWTVLLLASVVAVAASASRATADVTRARRAQAVARAMAESGVVAARAAIESGLRSADHDSTARFTYLDGLEASAVTGLVGDTLDQGVFAVTLVDVSARLDVNLAGTEGWRLLLRPHLGSRDAAKVAAAIDARVRGLEAGRAFDADESARRQRDSIGAAFLGRVVAGAGVHRPFETIDDLLEIPGLEPPVLARIAPLLTVDGNGSVNRRAAHPDVRAAAAGALVDHPSRLLVVSRGWMLGHPLTREIEAVFDIADDGLRLVRWRERDR